MLHPDIASVSFVIPGGNHIYHDLLNQLEYLLVFLYSHIRKKKFLLCAFTGSIRSFYENTVVMQYTDSNRAASGFLDDAGDFHLI